jgi:KDO2-lipid IV(A) lauroyltransferase
VCGPALGEPELRRLVDAAFASYARYWAESLRLPSLSGEQIDAGMSMRGFEHLYRALSLGRGAILALPHLGGWEWGGAFLAESGMPASVVVEPLEPPEVFEWFARFRRRLGMEVIPVGTGAAAACLRALSDNRVLCLLADRTVGSTPGVEVEFFGEATRLPAGPATLALRSGAALLPAAVYFGRRADDHLALVRPPIPVERSSRFRADILRITQAVAVELEGLVRRAPTQWHLMQPNWPSDTGPE